MPAAVGSIVKFSFMGLIEVPAGFENVEFSGKAEVLEFGFQMQLGTSGYSLKVVESARYAAGTIIKVFPGSVRG